MERSACWNSKKGGRGRVLYLSSAVQWRHALHHADMQKCWVVGWVDTSLMLHYQVKSKLNPQSHYFSHLTTGQPFLNNFVWCRMKRAADFRATYFVLPRGGGSDALQCNSRTIYSSFIVRFVGGRTLILKFIVPLWLQIPSLRASVYSYPCCILHKEVRN